MKTEHAPAPKRWIVSVDMTLPPEGGHRVWARSASAARYASFKAWIDAGYGWRFHNPHEAFVWFSKNLVMGVRRDRMDPPAFEIPF